MIRGASIGQFQILSIAEIKTSSLKLDSEIEELNNLKNVTYKKKLNDLQNSIKNLTTAQLVECRDKLSKKLKPYEDVLVFLLSLGFSAFWGISHI